MYKQIAEDSLKLSHICRRCHIEKSVSDFYKSKSAGGIETWCKACANANCEQNRRDNLELRNEQARVRRLKCVYGLSADQYDELKESQNHCCALCNRHESEFRVRLAVDHNHKTLEIRGLLCTECNRNKASHHTDGDELRKIATYVERSTGLFAPPRSNR